MILILKELVRGPGLREEAGRYGGRGWGAWLAAFPAEETHGRNVREWEKHLHGPSRADGKGGGV